MNSLYKSFLLLAIASLAACSNEVDKLIDSEPVADAVEFTAAMPKSPLQTRAGEEEEEIWLDMPYDTWQWEKEGTKTPIDFFIRQDVNEGTTPNLAIYNLEQGKVGGLEFKSGAGPLKWVSKNAEHRFHTWTEPEGVTMEANKERGTVDMSIQNLDYEYFVGTTAGPMNYGEQGVTVGLRYLHLISKIVIDRITLIYSDGSTNSSVWENVRSIMFSNMPFRGNFTTGIKEGDATMTVVHSTASEDRCITFSGNEYEPFIKPENSKEKPYIPLYVLPQSFTGADENGEFYVSLNHPTQGLRMYKGNLKDLKNEDDPEHSLEGIAAGDCDTIRLVLQDDEVHGYYTYVHNWNTTDPVTVTDKPYPGISSAAEILSNNSYVSPKTYKLNETFLDGLVYEEVDGKKVVRLCDNIDLIGNIDPEITLVIPSPYVLDGCNMNINCPTGLKLAGEYKNVYINGEGPQASTGA